MKLKSICEFMKISAAAARSIFVAGRLAGTRSGSVAAALSLVLFVSACTTMDKGGSPPAQQPPKIEPALIAPEPSSSQQELRFAVAGDIMAHDSQLRSAYDDQCGCYDFEKVFSPVAPLFRNVDVSIANLETTLPGKNYSGYPAFGAPDSLVDAVKSAGIDVLTTASNHCLDKGKDALVRTLRTLDEKGLPHLGTYASGSDYEKQRVFVLKKNGISVAMLNYTYGTNEIPTPDGVVVNRIDKDLVTQDIALAREKNVDAVIVLFHFGKEYLNRPDDFQREMVSHALANGADIVLGGHPHHVQPYEVMRIVDQAGKEKPHLVAYSLGNFVSAQRQPYTDGGMVLYFTLVKKQDSSGKVAMDISNVHHKLVWVHVSHDGAGRKFQVLPVEASLSAPADPGLPQAAIDGMKRFKADVEEVLKYKVDLTDKP